MGTKPVPSSGPVPSCTSGGPAIVQGGATGAGSLHPASRPSRLEAINRRAIRKCRVVVRKEVAVLLILDVRAEQDQLIGRIVELAGVLEAAARLHRQPVEGAPRRRVPAGRFVNLSVVVP